MQRIFNEVTYVRKKFYEKWRWRFGILLPGVSVASKLMMSGNRSRPHPAATIISGQLHYMLLLAET
jgi:hypothetical protein